MSQGNNKNLNIPLIYVSPVFDKKDDEYKQVENENDFMRNNKNNNNTLLTDNMTNNIYYKKKDNSTSNIAEDSFNLDQNINLKDFNNNHVNDIYMNSDNKLYLTTSNQSYTHSLNQDNFANNIRNNFPITNDNHYNNNLGTTNNNQNRQHINSYLGDGLDDNEEEEEEEDDIQSFYSAFADILLSPSDTNIITPIQSNNGNTNIKSYNSNTGSGDKFNLISESLRTTFLLPDMQKIKSNNNNSGLLTVNRVNSREDRSNSVSKKNGSRSRSRSRSRSHSFLSSGGEVKLFEDLRNSNNNNNSVAQETFDLENNSNNYLKIVNDDVESFSQVSATDMQELLQDLKSFDPVIGKVKEENVVTNIVDTTTTKYKLENSTDSQEKPFICEFCSFAFLRKHDLKRHKAKHLNLKCCSCKGYLIGPLPIEAEIFLYNAKNRGYTFDSSSLAELPDLIKAVEDMSNSKCWGCDKQFLRTDALNRHLKTKIGKECLKLPIEDFQSGNIYKTFKFLKMKEPLNSTLSSGSTNSNNNDLTKNNEKIRDKFIECNLFLKDMDLDLLEQINWPIDDYNYEEYFMETYERNLQKAIQRRVKIKNQNVDKDNE
ncbi:hypothetical protein HANVADRAFT_49959 [Hanseniaspora valbyensis NRRL Y-1626]|uniref:C2H2-type domain-containing protein n=1 Tax=Hanseniaspora valbyensis NRRL Y-1626 TaxID=766949 RepID=A0A1B7TA22_9ASCO|nr:hypothetical protein HANVADRAFT_49959 [Hanseniaspora valbyensis NRRL Y-1626]